MNSLEKFGKKYIQEVRDNSLFLLESIINGHMKDEKSQMLHSKILELNPDEIGLIKDITTYLIDNNLHNTLFFFEENPEWKIINNKNENLIELSDGLCGELYTDEGWIEKFSNYS